EFGNQRQQRFGEGVLVEADCERLAFGLPPIDFCLAVVGQRLVVLCRCAWEPRHRQQRRKEQSGDPLPSRIHVVLPRWEIFRARFYPVKQNRIPYSGTAQSLAEIRLAWWTTILASAGTCLFGRRRAGLLTLKAATTRPARSQIGAPMQRTPGW